MQRRVQREMTKKNKSPAGFSHLDDENYSLDYEATDHWGEHEDPIPHRTGCYELETHVLWSVSPSVLSFGVVKQLEYVENLPDAYERKVLLAAIHRGIQGNYTSGVHSGNPHGHGVREMSVSIAVARWERHQQEQQEKELQQLRSEIHQMESCW